MEPNVIYEIIGYVASVLIAVSLMMSAIIRLRIINLIGAATFCLYGLLIGAIPVAAMNGFIVLINIYYLSKILGDKEYFTLLRTTPESEYLSCFLDFYKNEIRKFQPEFSGSPGPNDINIFVLRDMVPAGLVIGTPDSDGSLTITLDFVIPNFRDFKTGKYLFKDRQNVLKDQGITKLVTYTGNKVHRKYLEKTGFQRTDQNDYRYEMTI